MNFQTEAALAATTAGFASVATVDWTMGVFGVPLSVFLAAFAGALISLSFLPPPPEKESAHRMIVSRAYHVACGTVLAAYLEPGAFRMLNHYIEPDLPVTLGLGVACALGVGLMLVIPIGLKWLRIKFGGAT